MKVDSSLCFLPLWWRRNSKEKQKRLRRPSKCLSIKRLYNHYIVFPHWIWNKITRVKNVRILMRIWREFWKAYAHWSRTIKCSIMKRIKVSIRFISEPKIRKKFLKSMPDIILLIGLAVIGIMVLIFILYFFSYCTFYHCGPGKIARKNTKNNDSYQNGYQSKSYIIDVYCWLSLDSNVWSRTELKCAQS